jgi:hypothetical protein
VPPAFQGLGSGGELVPTNVGEGSEGLALINTLEKPEYVAADASRARLELANRAGVLEAALDAADTIGAQNSLEKMLAHQLAAMHQAFMKLARQMNRQISRLDQMNLSYVETDRATVEATRLANTMARASAGFQQGLLTLQRLRTGGTQRVPVQHVTVEGCGRALVTCEFNASGGRSRVKGDGEKKDCSPVRDRARPRRFFGPVLLARRSKKGCGARQRRRHRDRAVRCDSVQHDNW